MISIPFVRQISEGSVGTDAHCQLQFEAKVIADLRGESVGQMELIHRTAIPDCISSLGDRTRGHFVCDCGKHLVYFTEYEELIGGNWHPQVLIYELSEVLQKVVSVLLET